MVRAIVERAGYQVLAGVDTAMDALNLVMAHQPDVLVLDLALNGMSGEEIIESIRECSETTVIVHSSNDPRFAVKRGARLFVSKGQLAQLEKTLQRVKGDAARSSA
jgi:DNA-binding response OmpR family regulator